MNKKILLTPLIITSVLISNIDLANALKHNCNYWENEITTESKLYWKNLNECAFKRNHIDIPLSTERSFETKYWFSENDRMRNATALFNCHSLAFNKRKLWMNYPHNIIYEFQKAWKITHLWNAKKWDRWVFLDKESNWKIIIWGNRYDATHSFTFMEDYKWENTKIKSKYGQMWEYVHKLSDVRKVYYNSNTKLIILESENRANFSYRSITEPSNLEEIISKDKKVAITNNQIFNKKISWKTKKEIINSITDEDLIEISLSSSLDKNSIKKLLEKNQNIKFVLNNYKKDKNIIYLIEEKIKKEWKTNDFLWNSF